MKNNFWTKIPQNGHCEVGDPLYTDINLKNKQFYKNDTVTWIVSELVKFQLSTMIENIAVFQVLSLPPQLFDQTCIENIANIEKPNFQ